MNAGAVVPYHLRTAKMADRSFFVELLRRLERIMRLDGYVYASMGGYPMADHHRVHRMLGLQRLFCFDEDPKTVRRQIFNKPIPDCRCVELTTAEFSSDPDRAYREAGIHGRKGQIVWLDYVRPADLGRNVEEFVSLLRNCEHGDVVRITLNANEKAIKGGREALPKPEKLKNRLMWIKEQVGQYVPEDAEPGNLTESGFPILLARILRAAAADALGDGVVRPLSLVRYADGQQMFAATMIVDKQDPDRIIELEKLQSWSLISSRWTEIHPLRIATLTSRERELVTRLVPSLRAEKLASDLPFDPFDGAMTKMQMAEHFKKYQDLLRFYPDVLVLE
ncbi:O-methyltransferase [Rhodobacter capsulatus]|uniref:O-methyltransferase n=1 Tax=Rhodobacter capsulatus TaxID=1061 RepID=UPI004026ED3D